MIIVVKGVVAREMMCGDYDTEWRGLMEIYGCGDECARICAPFSRSNNFICDAKDGANEEEGGDRIEGNMLRNLLGCNLLCVPRMDAIIQQIYCVRP